MNWFVNCITLALFSPQWIGCTDINKTQICTKEGIDYTNSSHWIVHEHNNFSDIIQHDVFVDKSLLLKRLWETEQPVILITAPHKWAKSTNLNMIQFFTDINRDNDGNKTPRENSTSYRFFTKGEIQTSSGTEFFPPPLISKEEDFIRDHLGNYAVIRVGLGHLGTGGMAPDTRAFFKSFQRLISEIFEKFRFLLNTWKNIIRDHTNKTDSSHNIEQILKNEKKFHLIINKQAKEKELLDSIAFLSNMLSNYFCENILLLIDDYDDLFNRFYFNEHFQYNTREGKYILTFLLNFIGYSFRGNHYYTRAIITGTTKIPRYMQAIGAENCEVLNAVEDIWPFFGFTQHEVEQLLRLRGTIEEDGNLVKGRYGHHTFNHHGRLFSPWVITHFLYTRQPEDYWTDNDNFIKNIDTLLKCYPFKMIMETLINLNLHYVIEKRFLQYADWKENMADLIRKKELTVTKDRELDGIMNWLFSFGYLAVSKIRRESIDTFDISIPNEEIRDYIGSRLKIQYKLLLGKHYQVLIDCSHSLKHYLDDNEQSSIELIQDLRSLLENTGTLNHFRAEVHIGEENWLMKQWNFVHTREAGSAAIIRKILTYMQIENRNIFQVEMPYKYKIPPAKFAHRIVYFGYDQKRAIIIELSGAHKSIDRTFNSAENYTLLLKDRITKFQVVKYIAITVPEEGATAIQTAMKQDKDVQIFIKTNS